MRKRRTDRLSDADWEELALLVEHAPPGRLHIAMSRLGAPAAESAPDWDAGIDRLFYLAVVSAGDAFDRALLQELRRLNTN